MLLQTTYNLVCCDFFEDHFLSPFLNGCHDFLKASLKYTDTISVFILTKGLSLNYYGQFIFKVILTSLFNYDKGCNQI